MNARAPRILLLVALVALAGCKDVKIKTDDNKNKFRFGTPVHLWVTYKDDRIPDTVPVTWSSDKDGEIGSGPDISATRLSAGRHKIKVRGTYRGKDFEKKKTIRIENDAPKPTIAEPARRVRIDLNSPLRLVGSATDREDGAVPSHALSWRSSLDGDLGPGAVITVSDLMPGTHVIELLATDLAGASDTARVQVEVVNQKPVPTITAPTGGARTINVGQPMTFRGSAVDPDPMQGTAQIPADSLEWVSDRDGSLGFGASITTNRLSGGKHTVKLLAKDEFDLEGEEEVEVEVVNRKPNVRITSPDDGDSFPVRADIRLRARVDDPDGFDVEKDEIVWRSSRDGKLDDRGDSIKVDDLSVGRHTITCVATDRHGASREVSIRITVTNEAPTVAIERPQSGVTVHYNQRVELKGKARDREEGNLSGSALEWRSRNEAGGRDKKLGTGRRLRVKGKDFGFGTHRITLRATDSYDAESNPASIRVTVPNRPPVVTIASPVSRTQVVAGSVVRFEGSAVDLDRDREAKDRELTWTAHPQGGAPFVLGTGRELELTDLGPGTYRVVLSAGDPDDDSLAGRSHVFLTVIPAATPTPIDTTGTGGAAGALGVVGR